MDIIVLFFKKFLLNYVQTVLTVSFAAVISIAVNTASLNPTLLWFF